MLVLPLDLTAIAYSLETPLYPSSPHSEQSNSSQPRVKYGNVR
jgi:hypothetical protein